MRRTNLIVLFAPLVIEAIVGVYCRRLTNKAAA